MAERVVARTSSGGQGVRLSIDARPVQTVEWQEIDPVDGDVNDESGFRGRLRGWRVEASPGVGGIIRASGVDWLGREISARFVARVGDTLNEYRPLPTLDFDDSVGEWVVFSVEWRDPIDVLLFLAETAPGDRPGWLADVTVRDAVRAMFTDRAALRIYARRYSSRDDLLALSAAAARKIPGGWQRRRWLAVAAAIEAEMDS